MRQLMGGCKGCAVRVTIPQAERAITMKHRILRVPAELTVPMTVRCVPGGLLFWRSTAEDLQQAQEGTSRLQAAQRGR